MSKEIKYTDEPMELGPIVDDLLPPEDIAESIKKQKVTIMLSASSKRFFEQQAKKYGVSYQAMIRRVLDEYANRSEN